MFDRELEIHEVIYVGSIIFKGILFSVLPFVFLFTVIPTISTTVLSLFCFYLLLWLLGPYLVIWGLIRAIQKSIKKYCDPIQVGKFELADKYVNIGFIAVYVAGYLISLFLVFLV